MRCEKCGKREATAHITKIVNGHKEELHICSECASSSTEYKEMKAGMHYGIGDFLTGIFSGATHTPIAGEQVTAICPTCNMNYDEFLKNGKLGCGDCYNVFASRICRPLKQIHGTFEHIGKVPRRGGGNLIISKKIAALEAKLQAAVQQQDFETAAKLRDEIIELKSTRGNEEV